MDSNKIMLFFNQNFYYIFGGTAVIMILILFMKIKKSLIKKNKRFEARIHLQNGDVTESWQDMTKDKFTIKGETEKENKDYIVVRESLRRELRGFKYNWYANYTAGIEFPFITSIEGNLVTFKFLGSKNLNSIVENKLIDEMLLTEETESSFKKPLIILGIVILCGIAYYLFGVQK